MSISWTFDDGTAVRLAVTASVRGDSPAANQIRAALLSTAKGFPPGVDILPPPGGSIALDASNAWLLDRWLRAQAARHDLTVRTDYAAPIEDAPSEVGGMVREQWPSNDAVIY